LRKSWRSLSLLVINVLSRLLSAIKKPIIMIAYVLAMDLISARLFYTMYCLYSCVCSCLFVLFDSFFFFMYLF
jgi:hypothetical protein